MTTKKKRTGLENGAAPTKPTTGQPGVENHAQVELRAPEPVSAPIGVEDPAIITGKEANEAEAAFNAVPGSTPAEEDTPLFKAAQERMEAADAAFADAPITTAAGAFAKMRAIVDIGSRTLEGPYLETRHFKTVFAFLEAVVGGKVAPIGDHPDAELIARVVEFYPALEKHNVLSEASDTRRAEADAMPDCPPITDDRWHTFMKAQGVLRLYNKKNVAGRAMGKAANHVFAVPARTYRGAVEKAKIAYLATGDGEGTLTGDQDLASFQDFKNLWMAKAIADLERLAGVS